MDLRKYLCMHPGCNHVASKLSKIDIISKYLAPILGHLYTKIQSIQFSNFVAMWPGNEVKESASGLWSVLPGLCLWCKIVS